MSKRTLMQRVDALEKKLRNEGCDKCKWSTDDGFECRNKIFEINKSTSRGDYTVPGESWKINANRDCQYFEKKRLLRWW